VSRRARSTCWPCLLGGGGIVLLAVSLFFGWVWPALTGG
jgi:hypothetical protein